MDSPGRTRRLNVEGAPIVTARAGTIGAGLPNATGNDRFLGHHGVALEDMGEVYPYGFSVCPAGEPTAESEREVVKVEWAEADGLGIVGATAGNAAAGSLCSVRNRRRGAPAV
jgi:hypothetical protein